MKIWQLLDSRGMGGIESHVLVLASALRGRGHDARIVLLHDHGAHPLKEAAARRGVPVIVAGGLAGLVAAWRGRRLDLLHTHGYKAGLLGRAFAVPAGCPVVSTFHNGDRGRGRLRLYTALDRWTGPLARQIAVSDEIAAGLRGPVARIDNFVELPERVDRPAARGPLRVGFVGRLVDDKGIDTFCRLAGRVPGVAWHVFGDGPLRHAAADLAPSSVIFHGAVCDLGDRWPVLDLLCMPSRREGLPMAALEAMASGVPVVAFGVGGLPSLIGDGRDGWLVAAGDETAMADRLRTLVEAGRAPLAAVGDRARATIRTRYAVEARLPEVLRVYGRALGRKAAASQDAVAICSDVSRRSATDFGLRP